MWTLLYMTVKPHLIKNICENFYKNKAVEHFCMEGYSNKDGTAIRDYIHVSDLAEAQINLKIFIKEKKSIAFTNGYGKRGNSVLNVIKTFNKIN